MTDPSPPREDDADALLGAAPDKPLSDAARRALVEAAQRRAAIDAAALAGPTGEQGGPAGLEPTRYGDWERKGLAIDFS